MIKRPCNNGCGRMIESPPLRNARLKPICGWCARGLTSVPRDSFGNYDPSDALLDHLDDQPAPVGTSRRTTLNSPVGYVALDTES